MRELHVCEGGEYAEESCGSCVDLLARAGHTFHQECTMGDFDNIRTLFMDYMYDTDADSMEDAQKYSVLKDYALTRGFTEGDVDDALASLKRLGALNSIGRLWWVVDPSAY